MFGFLKAKSKEIIAPVEGEVVSIESVNDDVFSQKMVGDGVAIKPSSNLFTAPLDGVVSKIFSTNHAYSIKSDKGLEVMVHIGLETVALDGQGFTRKAEEGQSVKVGDVIIEADLTYIAAHAKDTITPVIVLEESNSKSFEKKLGSVKMGDVIMEVK